MIYFSHFNLFLACTWISWFCYIHLQVSFIPLQNQTMYDIRMNNDCLNVNSYNPISVSMVWECLRYQQYVNMVIIHVFVTLTWILLWNIKNETLLLVLKLLNFTKRTTLMWGVCNLSVEWRLLCPYTQWQISLFKLKFKFGY